MMAVVCAYRGEGVSSGKRATHEASSRDGERERSRREELGAGDEVGVLLFYAGHGHDWRVDADTGRTGFSDTFWPWRVG